MLRLHILWVLSLAGCQESSFQNQVNSETSTADSIESTGSNEPVSVGGGFLTCQTLPVETNPKDYQAYCRLENEEGKKIEISATSRAFFQVELVVGGRYEKIDHQNLAVSENWHWLVSIPKEIEFTAIVLQLTDESQPDREPDEFIMTKHDWVVGAVGDSETTDQPPSLKLGSSEARFFFLGDNSAWDINRGWSCPFSEHIATNAQAATIEPTKTFEIEVPPGGAVLTIKIPDICGVSLFTPPPRVIVSYPDREPETYRIGRSSASFFVLRETFVDSGRLTITIVSLPRPLIGYDTFAFGNPELTSDNEDIKEILKSP